MTDDDRRLQDQLRAADPARALAPVTPEWLDHRMEQIMSDTTTAPTADRTSRRRWVPIAGIAAAAAAAAIAIPLALGGGPAPTVEALEQPTGGGLAAGSCAVLSPEMLAMQSQAFAARVLSVQGDTVQLEVTERFTGEVADRIEVRQVDAAAGDYSGVPFEADGSYLVAATDGVIADCGLSGKDSPELRIVYDAAFGS